MGLFSVQSYQVSPSGKNNLFCPDFYMGIDDKKQHASYDDQIDFTSGVNNVLYCPESIVGPKSFTMGAAQELSK